MGSRAWATRRCRSRTAALPDLRRELRDQELADERVEPVRRLAIRAAEEPQRLGLADRGPATSVAGRSTTSAPVSTSTAISTETRVRKCASVGRQAREHLLGEELVEVAAGRLERAR